MIFEIIFATLATAILLVWTAGRRKATKLPTSWPVVGMLPGLIRNSYRIHDYAADILAESGGSFLWKGPPFSNMDMFFTCDPANIHHIFSKNFSNYPKGPEFNKIFEVLGDSIFNADFELWELHRRTTLSFLTHPSFYSLLERAVWEKIETGLVPVLDHFSETGADVDLQDVFQRLTFDGICKLILDCDPRSLCVEMPSVACEKAINDAIHALLYRHLLPEGVWRLQERLGIGRERKLREASRAFDDFIYPCVERAEKEEERERFSLLASFMKENLNKNGSSINSRKFLRDTALGLMFAGRDTTSATLTWLFWLLASSPASQARIREEIAAELEGNNWRRFSVQESRKLVYLHGALCETLRLFPPLPLEHKAPNRPDDLPSGDRIRENSKVIISFYSVGRMESVWGKDCLEFRPERWITRDGKVKHEPSYKFPAFNAGPRTCLGKEMAFVQMKMVAATIIFHYNVEVVDGQVVSPRDSILLHTKHGLKVNLSKRNVCIYIYIYMEIASTSEQKPVDQLDPSRRYWYVAERWRLSWRMYIAKLGEEGCYERLSLLFHVGQYAVV